MYQVQIPWNKVFKGLKYLLILLILVGIGYVGYLTYYFATNSPQEVRVTNLTGSSATISWYTNRPDGGVVYVKDKSSFTPVFSKLGSAVAYDDRDVAKAQETWVNKQVSKATNDVDADYEVTLDEKALSELPVKKKGKYYVHHVTINNLQEERQYYFRVGNGVFMWNVNENNQKYAEYEAPTVKEFGFKTYKDPENLPSPSPIYGKVYSLARNKDGLLMQNINTDSVVFVNAWKLNKNEFSGYLSSVTNSVGGWTVDQSSIRDLNGNIGNGYVNGKDKLYAYVQLENSIEQDLVEGDWGKSESSMPDLIVNNEKSARISGTIFDAFRFSLKTSIMDNHYLPGTFKLFAARDDDDVYVPPVNSSGSPDDRDEKPVKSPNSSGSPDDRDETPNPSTGTPSGNDNDTSDSCVYLTCGDNEWKKGCSCIKRNTSGSPDDRDENSEPSSPAVVQAPNPTGNTGSNNNDNTNLDMSCEAGGMETIVIDGKRVCKNSTTQRVPENAKCTGRVTNGCEANAGCFCELEGSAGYARLDNESCRPAGCASVINGDVTFVGGVEHTRKYTDEYGNEVLCGAKTDGKCAIVGKNFVTTRGGKIICNQGFKLNDAENGCVDDPAVPNSDEVDSSGSDARTHVCVLPGGERKTIPISQECPSGSNNRDCGIGQVENDKGGCSCQNGFKWASSNSCVPDTNSNLNPIKASGACKSEEEVFNCGAGAIDYSNLDENGRYTTKSCAQSGSKVNQGCGNGYTCNYVSGAQGYCVKDGLAVSFEDKGANAENVNGFSQDCYALIDDKTGAASDVTIVEALQKPDDKAPKGKHWVQMWVEMCVNDDSVGSMNNKLLQMNNISLINKVSAAETVKTSTNGNYLVVFPESGTYDVTIGNEEFKNIYIDKKNEHFFYKENNGKSGYQLPSDPKKLSATDDVLLPASGAVVTLYEKAKNQSMKLSKGINIVSFNYLPSRVEGKNMNAKQLMRILNSSGTKVTRITTFEGGKWLGGLAYDSNKGEIVGNDFLVLPGKGYLIVSNTDYTATVPGYGIKNSIPVALSDGWNLVGVNGFSKTYTAASMIKSVSEIDGIGANNVTWWPTSKGRYESFQKSEGTEYGFDFPLLKDVGYFVRINKFDRDGAKSVIWNPGGDLHGENGSK